MRKKEGEFVDDYGRKDEKSEKFYENDGIWSGVGYRGEVATGNVNRTDPGIEPVE